MITINVTLDNHFILIKLLIILATIDKFPCPWLTICFNSNLCPYMSVIVSKKEVKLKFVVWMQLLIGTIGVQILDSRFGSV